VGRKTIIVRTTLVFLLKFLISLLSLLGTVAILLFLVYTFYRLRMPTVDEIIASSSVQNTKIVYSNGVDIIKAYGESGINTIKLEDIPKDLVNALLATEDRKFFSHRGIDYFGILRALVVNVRSGQIAQGGSTITQQLSKIIISDSSRTISRKIRELILTVELEKYLAKEDILAMYLAKAYFGAGQWGVREASRFYFAKELSKLQLQECAMLVGLLKAPTRYSPVNSVELAVGRMTQVIINMQKAGFIDDDCAIANIIHDISLPILKQKDLRAQNYYFTDWINSQWGIIGLESRMNKISVVTTLDKFVQNETVIVVDDFVRENRDILKNAEIAVIAMNRKGEILSMIGGKNYHQSQFNRAVYARRQTGSIFKLFVYLAGFENGLKISDSFIDEPIRVGNWQPENYGEKYSGQMTVKEAFITSSNSVAVQIADNFGIDRIVKIARKLGLTGKFRNDLTISLGSQESTLLEITAAYATILNDGIPVLPHGIRRVNTAEKILYESGILEEKSVLSDKTIDSMQYLLYSVVNEGTGKKAAVDSLVNKTIAYNMMNADNKFFIGGKTGSSKNNIDAWFVGFANDLTIGVWIGNDDGTKMDGIMGGNLPARLWKNIVEGIFQ
jgi:penicillin-binding protein 1A